MGVGSLENFLDREVVRCRMFAGFLSVAMHPIDWRL